MNLHVSYLRRRSSFTFMLLLALFGERAAMSASSPSAMFLPDLPQAIAGQCVGTAGSLLVVAGGSSWTAPPWANGTKVWSAGVYSLRAGGITWRTEHRLSQPMGYGASAQHGNTLLCIGGQNGSSVFQTVLRFREEYGDVMIDTLTPLPEPLTNAAAAVVGDMLYVVGGQHTLAPGSVTKDVWSLSLRGETKAAAWKRVTNVPWSQARILPAVAGCDTGLYVMSGADLASSPNDTPVRTYLNDAWKMDKHGHWTKLPDLPAATVAAPALCDALGRPLVFGGDDGELVAQAQTLRDAHPGFSKDVRVYDAVSRAWRIIAHLPLSLVTTAAAHWNGQYVLAGGEPLPGHRSAKVIAIAKDHLRWSDTP